VSTKEKVTIDNQLKSSLIYYTLYFQTEALKHLQCLKPSHRPLIRKCFDKYSNELKMAAYRLDSMKGMLPHICCGFFETKQCVQERLVNVCGSAVDSEANAGNYLSQLADAMGKDMIGVACARHTSGDSCSRLQSLPVVGNLNGTNREQFDREFILMPFIRVSERMVKSD
jgi:hypothetical protein